jgi:hypothetical protein
MWSKLTTRTCMRVHGPSCPWAKQSLVRVVQGPRCPRSELSPNRFVFSNGELFSRYCRCYLPLIHGGAVGSRDRESNVDTLSAWICMVVGIWIKLFLMDLFIESTYIFKTTVCLKVLVLSYIFESNLMSSHIGLHKLNLSLGRILTIKNKNKNVSHLHKWFWCKYNPTRVSANIWYWESNWI